MPVARKKQGGIEMANKFKLMSNNINIKGGDIVNKAKVLEKGTLNRQELLKVYILPEGRVEFEVISVNTGAIYDRCRCSSKVMKFGGIKKMYKNFNEEVIVLNLDGIAGTEYVGLFTGDIVIDLGRDVYYHDRNGNVFRSWKAPISTLSESEIVERGFIRVRPALMSPSQEKSHEVTCIVHDDEEFEDKVDRLTDGLFSIMKRVYKEVSYEKLIKLVGYMATGLAPSRKFEYSIDCIAILMSKSRMADGAGFIKAKGAIPAGIGVQSRNFGSDKGHYLSIREEVMKEFINNFKKVHIKEITPDVQKLFEEAFVRENEFSGKLLIIGEGIPDLFMDMNIIKTPFDLARFRRNELRVLDISPNSNDEIAFGSQMAQTLILNNEAREVLIRKTEEALKAHIEDFCNKEAEVLLTFNQFLEGLEYIPGLIEKINPGMKLVDPALYRVSLTTLYNKITNILSEFRIPTGGTFARVFCDFAEDFGEKILKENEIFSPDLEKKGVKYAVGIRSPKGGLFEFNVYKIVDKKELNRRIRGSRIKGHIKGALIKLFGSIKPGAGLAVVPASKYTMLLHSGMDFDYDGMSLFWDKDVVELFKNIRPTALLVEDEGNTSQDASTYSVGDMAAVIKGQFANPNLPIGVVCNHAHTWMALLGNLDFARIVLKHMFGSQGKTQTYEPLEKESLAAGDLVRTDAKKVEEILAKIRCVDFDSAPDEAITNILIDINHIMNRFIQKTIDASKTGESIVIHKELLVNNVVDTFSLRQMRITSSRTSKRQMAVADGLYIEVEPKGPSYQVINKDGKVIYAFSDFIHEIRKEALRRVLPELKKIATYEPKLGPELAAARQTVLNKLSKEAKNDLILFKKYYGDLTGHRTTSISKINEIHSRFIRDELIRRVNKNYKASLEYLANSIRLATASMSPTERILAVMGIASNPREGLDAPSNTMPLNTLGEEYIILASKLENGVKYVGERIRGASAETLAEGVVVTVKDGMIAESNLTVDLPDGEYVTKHIDGAVYAVKTVEEIVKDLGLIKLNNKIIIRLSSGTDIDLADIPSEAKIVTWKYAGRDAYGDLAIDLAAGHTPYSKVLANVVAKVEKTIRAEISYRNGKGLSTILCLSAIRREGKPSAKKVKVTR